jgi:hypothetical protein
LVLRKAEKTVDELVGRTVE